MDRPRGEAGPVGAYGGGAHPGAVAAARDTSMGALFPSWRRRLLAYRLTAATCAGWVTR